MEMRYGGHDADSGRNLVTRTADGRLGTGALKVDSRCQESAWCSAPEFDSNHSYLLGCSKPPQGLQQSQSSDEYYARHVQVVNGEDHTASWILTFFGRRPQRRWLHIDN